ncbi:hypothetical protein MLD52_02760 [Puniceicoccaceae bacterium K14]|nr:hypothetical protein [Puniceicoccaceae bacterium K14]
MLQTVDPLFPIGSYAHSYGLEELVQLDRVKDPESLQQYIDSILFPNLELFELPYLRFLYEIAHTENWGEISILDQEIGAAKLTKEIRNASSSQGQQRLRILRKLRPCSEFEKLQELKLSKEVAPHHLTVNAIENSILQTPLLPTLSAWTYQALAAPCSASLKLFRIGQEGAQQVLTQSIQKIENVVEKSLEIERDHAGCFNPLLDIASARHEQAFSRLFIS